MLEPPIVRVGEGGVGDGRAGEAPAVALRCPRCDYDVSGTPAAWTDRCPLEGRCTECGLTFGWAEMFDPIRAAPRWFFEASMRRHVRAMVWTAARTTLPWHFWDRIRITLPVRPARLIAMLLCVLLVGWAGVTLALGLSEWYIGQGGWVAPLGFRLRMIPGYLGDNSPWFLARPSRDDYDFACLAQPVLIACAVIPGCFALLGDSLTRVRVRPAHLLRAGVCNAVGLLVLYAAFTLSRCAAGMAVHWEYRRARRNSTLGNLLWDFSDKEDLFAYIASAWLLLAWLLTIRLYLRLPNALAVASAFMLIAALVVGAYYLFLTDSILAILFREAW